MNWMLEISKDKDFQNNLYSFLDKYGMSELGNALQYYQDMNQEYICKTRAATTKIKISDIYYLKICRHSITVYTTDGEYNKYGTLKDELKKLAPYGFIRCSQSHIVSIKKIKRIVQDNVILENGQPIHMSRNYANMVIMNFHSFTL